MEEFENRDENMNLHLKNFYDLLIVGSEGNEKLDIKSTRSNHNQKHAYNDMA